LYKNISFKQCLICQEKQMKSVMKHYKENGKKSKFCCKFFFSTFWFHFTFKKLNLNIVIMSPHLNHLTNSVVNLINRKSINMGCGASRESFDPSKETIQEYQSRQYWNHLKKMNNYEKNVFLLHTRMSVPYT